MATTISEEELLLRKRARRRLVGAIVLVIIAIILLPAIFDDPKPSEEKQKVAINLPLPSGGVMSGASDKFLPKIEVFDETDPSIEFQNKMKASSQLVEDEAELTTTVDRKRTPIPGIKPKIEKAITAPLAVVASTTAPQNPASAIVQPQPAVSAIAPPPPAPTSTPQASDTGKGFIIQLGAYSDQIKAKQQHASLVSNGFKAYTEVHNDITRVRIGPFSTRMAADQEIKKLKQIGLDGVVIPR